MEDIKEEAKEEVKPKAEVKKRKPKADKPQVPYWKRM